jgi:hypothetical protein
MLLQSPLPWVAAFADAGILEGEADSRVQLCGCARSRPHAPRSRSFATSGWSPSVILPWSGLCDFGTRLFGERNAAPLIDYQPLDKEPVLSPVLSFDQTALASVFAIGQPLGLAAHQPTQPPKSHGV